MTDVCPKAGEAHPSPYMNVCVLRACCRWYAPEVVFKDPMLHKNKMAKDTKIINDLFKVRTLPGLPLC